MFGFFLWVCLLPDLWLASFAQEENAKSCFLYPVSKLKSSPLYNIKSAHEHFVTINHIFRNPNIVQFLDQNKRCVLALKQMTSETVDCSRSIPADGEYTTLVYRRTDDILTVHKKNSPLYNIDLRGDIQTLEVSSSDMVNIAFNCPGDCYTFEKATIPLSQEEGTNSYSSFIVHGRIKPSANSRNLGAEVLLLKEGQNKSLDIESLIPEVESNGWFSLKFSATFRSTYGSDANQFYVVDLIVTNPLKSPVSKIYETLLILSKDLYLNFNSSKNVLWSVNCKPRNEVVGGLSCKPNKDSTLAISCRPGANSLQPETDCYTFKDAMLHINYTEEQSDSSFVIYGKNQSPAGKVFLEAMHGVKTRTFKDIYLDVPNSDDWFQIEFHVAFGPYVEKGTYPYYPLHLNVSNPRKGFVPHELRVATKDLYLNFNGSDEVLWAISCKHRKDTSLNASALYGESRIAIFTLACLCGILALIVIALTFYKCRVSRDRAVSLPKTPAPPPPDARDPAPEDTAEADNRSLAEHLYESVDLTVFREQMSNENLLSLENLPEEHGASTERNSHTSINSTYGLTRAGEIEDLNINGKETEIVSPK